MATLAAPATVRPDAVAPPPIENGPADPGEVTAWGAEPARAELSERAPDPAAPVTAPPEPVDPDPPVEVCETAPVEPDGPPFPVAAALADVGLADTGPLLPPAADALEIELPVAPEDEFPVAPAVAPPLAPPLEFPVAGPVGPLASVMLAR